MLSKVKVDLNDYSYDIIISNSFIHSSVDFIRPFLKRNKVALITDENVERFHLDHFRNSLKANGIDVFSLSVSPGEISKDWNTLKRVVDWMLEVKLERDDLILAFGGGVIGDLVGFASSIVRRGIDYIQIPTSLLAQVDSSVGGKTGINSKYGKNLVGIDATDPNGFDDVVVQELRLPSGREVIFKMRSQDVLHSAYMPHFRAQMNCVPGMITEFAFTPTVTTEEIRQTDAMRAKVKKINKIRREKSEALLAKGEESLEPYVFDYLLLCNKICGASHYNMQIKIIVETQQEFEKWINDQQTFAEFIQ